MSLVLHPDLYPINTIATVSGISGMASGIGTIIATYLIGIVSDHYSFSRVLIGVGTLPLIATALTLLLVQKGKVNRGQLEAQNA